MAETREHVYWDAAAFLAIFRGEQGHVEHCLPLFREASQPRGARIFTSALTIAECPYGQGDYATHEKIREFFENPAIVVVNLDRPIAESARDIQNRCHSEFGVNLSPRDAIHIATALDERVQCARLLTYDAHDLYSLSGRFTRPDGGSLIIQEPLWQPISQRFTGM